MSPPLVSFRDRLAEYIGRQADWRAQKAAEYSDDPRNQRSAEGLKDLGEYVWTLPEDDPRLEEAEAAYGIDVGDAGDISLMVGEEAARVIGRFRLNIPAETFDGLLQRLPEAFRRDREQAQAEARPTVESEVNVNRTMTREERLAAGCPTCADFKTQAEAQEWFEANGGSKDNNVANLDPNRNGIACENLPGTPKADALPPIGASFNSDVRARRFRQRVRRPGFAVRPLDRRWAVWDLKTNNLIDVRAEFEEADRLRRELENEYE